MQITLKKIVCPVDFSENSQHALDYAAALAATFGSELILLHVIEPPIYAIPSYPVVSEFSAETMEEIRKSTAERLRATAEKVRGQCEKVTEKIATGTPFLEIINTAADSDADLIVLGTHGRTGLSHVLIGSVAEKVVRKSSCPVLTVKHPEHEFIAP